jgi:hypothetical protein
MGTIVHSAGHATEGMHAPQQQTSPESQAVPQLPQFAASVFRSAQALTHVPHEHTSPVPHPWPHVPQFEVSASKLAQAVPPQSPYSGPTGQSSAQSPIRQTSFHSQAFPQAPQLP